MPGFLEELLRQSQQANTGELAPDSTGVLSGPAQALKPAVQSPGRDRLMARAAASLAAVPTADNIAQQVQGQIPAPPPDFGPPIPAGQPTGPSEGEAPFILGGLGKVMDFISRLGYVAPALGKWRDPNTGVVYDVGPRSAADVLPPLALAPLPGLLPSRLAAGVQLQQEYGIGLAEQVRQVFETPGSIKELVRSLQTPEGAQIAEAPRAGLQATLGGIAGFGKAAGKAALSLLVRDYPAVADSVRSMPGIIPDEVRYFREEMTKSAAGEAGDFSAFLSEGVNPAWLPLGFVPVGRLGTVVGRALGEIPIVGYAGKGIIGTVKDIAGAGMFDLTNRSKAFLAARDTHDALSGMALYKGLVGKEVAADTPSLLRMVEEFMGTPFDEFDGPWFKDANAVAKNGWSSLGKYKGLATDYIEMVRGELLDGKTVPAERVIDELGNIVEVNERRALDVATRKGRGRTWTWWNNVLENAVEAPLDKFAAYWRPLVLYTRGVYHLNNYMAGLAMDMQRYGFSSLWRNDHMKALQEWDMLQEGVEKLTGQVGQQLTAAPLQAKLGFSEATGGVAELPSLYQKAQSIPVIGKAFQLLGKSKELAGDIERNLKAGSYANYVYPAMREEMTLLRSRMSPEAQEVLGEFVSVKDLTARLQDLGDGVVNFANHVPYEKMDFRTADKLRSVLSEKLRTKVVLDSADVLDAFKETADFIRNDGLLKRAQAMGFDMLGKHQAGDIHALSGMANPGKDALVARANEAEELVRREDLLFQELMVDNMQAHTAEALKVASRKRPLSKMTKFEHERRAEVLRGLMGNIGKLQEWEHRTRAALNEQVRRDTEPMVKLRNAVPGVSEKIDARWNQYWNEERIPLVNEFQRRAENLYRIAQEGMLNRLTPKEIEKRMTEWFAKEGNYVLPDNVIERISKIRTRSVKAGGGLDQQRFEDIMREAGFDDAEIPGRFIDYVAQAEKDVAQDLAQLDRARASFVGRRMNIEKAYKRGTQVPPSALEGMLGGMKPEELLSEARQRALVIRDRGIRKANEVQMDYLGGTKNIDRFLNLVFPFGFWQTRYMAFQIKNAVQNPQQALFLARTLRAWTDANKDRPFWDRLNVTTMVINPGTPEEAEVNFNPSALLFPAGGVIGEVMRAADPDVAKNGGDAFELLSNFLGGGTWPFIPVLAGQLGLDLEGGPPKSFGDMVKGLVPPMAWARQALAAIPGTQAMTLAMLTDQEVNQVVRAMSDDVNAGLLPLEQAKAAAVSLKLSRTGKAELDPIAMQYLGREAPERLAASLVRAQLGPMKARALPERVTSAAFEALESAKTETERSMVYQNFPGLKINVGNKQGDELELAIIHLNAPENPVYRSMYYQQNADRIDTLTNRIDTARGQDKEVARWRLRAATPESFEAFRQAGGAAAVPELAGYWLQGRPLSGQTRNVLHELYGKYGMGALTFEDWRDRILLDAYQQWTIQYMNDLRRLRISR